MIGPPMTYYKWITSPLGALLLASNGRSLTGLYVDGQKHFPEALTRNAADWQEAPELDLLLDAEHQLAAYFAHQRQHFDLPLEPAGTPFQIQVWKALQQIPFGQTWSYSTLARAIEQPSAFRAVGAANGRNPISIIVPCHRVIASNGQLTGYAGGLDRKQWLLQHEQSALAAPLQSQAAQLQLFDV